MTCIVLGMLLGVMLASSEPNAVAARSFASRRLHDLLRFLFHVVSTMFSKAARRVYVTVTGARLNEAPVAMDVDFEETTTPEPTRRANAVRGRQVASARRDTSSASSSAPKAAASPQPKAAAQRTSTGASRPPQRGPTPLTKLERFLLEAYGERPLQGTVKTAMSLPIWATNTVARVARMPEPCREFITNQNLNMEEAPADYQFSLASIISQEQK